MLLNSRGTEAAAMRALLHGPRVAGFPVDALTRAIHRDIYTAAMAAKAAGEAVTISSVLPRATSEARDVIEEWLYSELGTYVPQDFAAIDEVLERYRLRVMRERLLLAAAALERMDEGAAQSILAGLLDARTSVA